MFGICSKTCGKGLRTTHRTKIVHEKDGGKCLGETTKQQECNVMDCPGKYIIFKLSDTIAIMAYQFDPSSAMRMGHVAKWPLFCYLWRRDSS